ncbi:unnamed protein product [Arabidopsis halleri]
MLVTATPFALLARSAIVLLLCLSLQLQIAPGLANLSITGCGSDDSELKEEIEKQFVDLLTEELKLQEAVADEHSHHMNVTLAEAKRVASQYQKEAEKCNAATEICESARERAQALLLKERKITFCGSEELGN